MSPNIVVLRRELLWVVIGLVTGLLLLPPLIWLVGSHVFGPYAAGNARDLVDHFYRGLGQGQQAPWIVFGPGAALFITVLGLNFVGDAVRDALDPRSLSGVRNPSPLWQRVRYKWRGSAEGTAGAPGGQDIRAVHRTEWQQVGHAREELQAAHMAEEGRGKGVR